MNNNDFYDLVKSGTITPDFAAKHASIDLSKLEFLVRNKDANGQMVDAQVREEVKKELVNQLQNSPSVHTTFFSDSKAPVCSPVDAAFMDQTICALVCSSIARSSLFGFSATINLAAADQLWEMNLASPKMTAENKALYDRLFPAYCKVTDGYSFNFFLLDRKSYAAAMKDCIISDKYLTMVLSTLFTDPDCLNQLELTLYKLRCLDSSLLPEVLQKWEATYPDKSIAQKLESLAYTGAKTFSADEFLSQVNGAINISRHQDAIIAYQRVPVVLEPAKDFFGESVLNFIKQFANQYGLYSGAGINNVITEGSSGGGCFIGEAPLMLANGEEVSIETIQPGMRILGYGGMSSVHSDELVCQEVPNSQTIYGINNYKPFFTAGHAFMTPEGWKAINPLIANEENPSLKVCELKIGDYVYQVSPSSAGQAYHLIEITEISQTILTAGEKIYGLHLIDGPHSYHVHRFVVRMNYPMITAYRLTQGFATLTQHERKLIHRQFLPVMPLLKKAVGNFIEQPLLKALNAPSEIIPESVSSNKKTLQSTRFKEPRVFSIRCHSLKSFLFEKNDALDELYFDGAHLFLKSAGFLEKIENFVLKGDQLKWKHKTRQLYTTGHLQFKKEFSVFEGFIFSGPDANSAQSHRVVGDLPPITYKSRVSILSAPNTEILPHPTGPSDWQDGLELQLELIMVERKSLPTPQLKISAYSDSQKTYIPLSGALDPSMDFNPSIEETHDGHGNYVINFPASSDRSMSIELFGTKLPASGKLTFSFDANSFSGYLQKFDKTSSKIPDQYYTWEGTLIDSKPSLVSHLENTYGDLTKLPVPNLRSELLTDVDEPLSLPDLILSAPADADVRKLADEMLIENMKWAIGANQKEWLSNFFGENQPLLPEERINEIKDSLDFYTNQFAVGYLGLALNKISPDHGGPSSPLDATQTAKLHDFMETGLAKQDHYAKQTTLIHRRAYVACSPRLKQYIDDTTTNWAEELFQYSTSNQIIVHMAGSIAGDSVAALGVINGRATLLTVLDPTSKGGYVKDYYLKLKNSGAFSQWANSLSNDNKTIKDWLTHFFNGLIYGGTDVGGYSFAESSTELSPVYGVIYVAINSACLCYTVINPVGKTVKGVITEEQLGHKINEFVDASGKLDLSKLNAFMPTVLQITAARGDTYAPSKSISGEVFKEFISELTDIQLEAVKNSLDLAEVVAEFIAITFDPSNPMSVFDRIFDTDIQAKIDSFAEKHPNWMKLGAGIKVVIRMAAFAYALFDVINILRGWDELSDAEKAGAIITVIQLSASLLEAVPTILSRTKATFSYAQKILIRNKVYACAEIEMEPLLADQNGSIAESLSEAFTKNGELVESWASRFAESIKAPLKGLGLLTSAAFAGLAINNFVQDFTGNMPVQQKAFDGIIMSSMIMETLFTGLDIFAADCACAAAFGPAGVIFAVIGVIFTLVELFHPAPKPESPTDKFFRETLLPFIASITNNMTIAIQSQQQLCILPRSTTISHDINAITGQLGQLIYELMITNQINDPERLNHIGLQLIQLGSSLKQEVSHDLQTDQLRHSSTLDSTTPAALPTAAFSPQNVIVKVDRPLSNQAVHHRFWHKPRLSIDTGTQGSPSKGRNPLKHFLKKRRATVPIREDVSTQPERAFP